MDKIYIRDLEFIGYHGVFEEEKKIGQKFFVSLELTTNLRKAGLNDDITKTTHYGEVAESVKKIFFQKKYDLIETLAEDIAREILLNYPLIRELKLEIKKPWAPVGIPLKDVSVEITRKWNEVYISLGSNMGNKKENLEKAIKEKEYADYFEKLFTLVPTIDKYFETVIVMDEDKNVRDNRIGQLTYIMNLFDRIAYLNKLD